MPLDYSTPNRTTKSRQYKEYVRGPLPLKWFQRASTISRTAGVVGLIIWRDAYQKKLWGYDSQRRGKMMISVIECFIVCRLVFGGNYCLTPFTFLP